MHRAPTRLSRRALLRGLAATGAAGLVAACGGGRGPGTAASPVSTGSPTGDIRQQILDQLGIDAPLDLAVIIPVRAVLSGPDRRIPFGLGTSPTDTVADLDITTYLVSNTDLEVVGEPTPAPYHDEGLGEQGVYVLERDLPDAGAYWLVAAAEDHAAVGGLNVFPADDLEVPEVGTAFPSAVTPTTADDMGLEELCTREPDCSMHDVSLDQALAAGRPIVLTAATPKYCQTAICGPVVDVVEGVKEGSGRDDVAWIHVEVYSDAGNTTLPFITETLKLPSEPWTFFVAADGTLADRFEGPTPADLLRASLDLI